ncbi:hypothetical protein Tco_1575172 [Tanacetum coccineum]
MAFCEPGVVDLTLVVAIPTVLVLVPTILIVGLAVVLYGRKTGWSDLVRHRWQTVTGISLVKICCGCLRDVFLDVISLELEMSADEKYQVGEAPIMPDVDPKATDEDLESIQASLND